MKKRGCRFTNLSFVKATVFCCGESRKLISIVCKKMAKGYAVEQIADMLEEEEDTIQAIYNIAKKYAPDYDVEKIEKEIEDVMAS